MTPLSAMNATRSSNPLKPNVRLKPLVKYSGGKSRELAHYLKYFPKDYNIYFEPFLGGAATFFALEPQRAFLGDVNEPLIDFYRAVRDDYDSLSAELSSIQRVYEANQSDYDARKAAHPDDHVPNANEAFYYDLRDQYNGVSSPRYSRAALYYFINKTAYSGIIRHNALGQFNVSFGYYRHFNAALVTRDYSSLLKRASLFRSDYDRLFRLASRDDFMFLDPPYDCVFTDYGNAKTGNARAFDETEQRRLAAAFRRLECRALMVINHTPLTEELYGDLVKDEYAKGYSMNIRNRFRSTATHYVVTNYPVEKEPTLFNP